MSDFLLLYDEIFRSCGLHAYVTRENAEAFEKLTALLLDANGRMNLTAILSPRDVILKHYADCLLSAHLLPQNASLLDVGCGGGFPALPLAIARPDLHITALDATAKKLAFVDDAAKQLGLSVKTVAGRAEELGRDPSCRAAFDAVTARAVAELRILAEWCLPFLSVGGTFLAMKGSSGEEELKNARNALKILGAEVLKVEKLPLGDARRVNILIKKVRPTPRDYPRKNARIIKEPL